MGIMLFEMLTGHIPYDGDSAVTIALQHFQKPLPSILAENRNVPQALENVVIRATAKKLENRYNSTLEMSRDLVTSLHPSHRRDAKVVFDDMTDTKTLPRLIQFHQQALRKRPLLLSHQSLHLLQVNNRGRKRHQLRRKRRRIFFSNLTQGFPRTCLYWYYHLCLFGIYQS